MFVMEFSYFDFNENKYITSENGLLVYNTRLDEKFMIVKKLLWAKYDFHVVFELKTHTTSSSPYQYNEQTLLHENYYPTVVIPQDNKIKMYEANAILKDYLRYVFVTVRNLNDGITASTSSFFNDDFIIPYRIKDVTYEMLLSARKFQTRIELDVLPDLLFEEENKKKKWYQFW